MQYTYDKDQIKEELSLEQIEQLLEEFGGEPQRRGDVIVSRTICHNPCHCGSHKLYYYSNSKLFKCYTDCGTTWDIYELIRKVMSREHPKQRENPEWNLPEAIDYVAQYFGYSPDVAFEEDETDEELNKYWAVFNSYNRIKDINKETQQVELKFYNDNVIKNLPRPRLLNWESEGITKEICDYHNICYDPKNCGIVIPHYDENNNLIGIRERTLITENAERYGKYLPARINNVMYNHPLSFALYNLNWSKDNIKKIKKAIVFESEKSCLQYASMFGRENDISVACCGSSLIGYQVELLKNKGVNEIIVGFDHDFTDLTEKTAKNIIKKYKSIYLKYGNYITISFIWDKNNLTPYKASPTDCGKEIFLTLFKERVNLYEN